MDCTRVTSDCNSDLSENKMDLWGCNLEKLENTQDLLDCMKGLWENILDSVVYQQEMMAHKKAMLESS